ncbi:AfsR/SARP family transcriptional regulator [Amycolatopsis kentuckyensis]|uniref:AfsR/SARP family transcriptional regulator n=1 Tax=Amycolatopsis kentuckyensis TaxID=218823 RepID=UPI00117807B3|nr:BTAD domain-containing putative transcriptional regulator [Amycolatopsis kentuckyensis]
MTEWIRMLAGDSGDGAAVILHLFGSPFVTIGSRRMSIPDGSKRLVAFVALHHHRVQRRYAAGTLWPIGDDLRAGGNLRTALWRLNQSNCPLLMADKSSLALRTEVVVDVRVVSQWASRLIDGSASGSDLTIKPWGVDVLDLLPGWYDDWALMERERVRQRLLHALEALSTALVRGGRCGEAVEAAMLAVGCEPLRESAQRTLLQAHIAEGNWIEARRNFEAYRSLLLRELGTEPPPSMTRLLRQLVRRRQAPEESSRLPVTTGIAHP